MTRTRKLESYTRHMVANGVGEATAFPPAWQLLWSVGLEIPPPPFLGFVSLAVITGGFFGPMFGLGAWLLGNRGVREMPATEALWVALSSVRLKQTFWGNVSTSGTRFASPIQASPAPACGDRFASRNDENVQSG